MIRVGLVAAGLMWVFALPALAADAETIAVRVSERIMSPYCPGITLHDCASTEALHLRDRIEEWARNGLTEADIMRRLEAEFGPAILAVPEGGVPVWLLPSGALVAGAAVGVYLLRRWTAAAGPAEPEIDATPAERARLESALDDLRGRA